MTFLAPLAGIIAAAVSVPTLLLYYFLKLRRRPLRVSSTLLWERAVQDLQVNTPFRWLRVSWILLLQIGILASLVLAVARPAIKGGGPGAARIVIMIDRSASMSALDGAATGRADRARPASRLDEAKRRALELVDELRRRSGGLGRADLGGAGGQRAAVVEFAARASARTPFTTDAGRLGEAIEGVTPTDQPGDLAGALRLLDAMGGSAGTGEEAAHAERTLVYLFSDGSFPQAESLPRARGVEVRHVRVGPSPPAPASAAADSPGVAKPPAPAPIDNLGIVAISARRDYEDPAIVRIFVRVQNAAPMEVETTLELRINGEFSQLRPVTVPGSGAPPPPREGSPPGVGAPAAENEPAGDNGKSGRPGEAAVTLELQNTAGGVVAVSIAHNDLLASDNTAALVLEPPAKPRVLAVGPEQTGSTPAAPTLVIDPFLQGALEAMDLRSVRVVDSARYEQIVAAGATGEGEGLKPYDLVVFDRVSPASLPSLPSIGFGRRLPIPGLEVSPVPANQAGAGHFLSWRRTHPVMRYVSLDQVIVLPQSVVTLPNDLPEGQRTGPAGLEWTALAWGAAGPMIVQLEGDGGRAAQAGRVRRILVAFELQQSTWGPDFSFPVFLSNAVEHLTLRGSGGAGRALTTADPVTVKALPGARELRVRGPLEERVEVPRPAESADASAAGPVETPIGLLERAGVYRVEGAAPPDDVLAVNLCDPLESRLLTAQRPTLAGAPVQEQPGSKVDDEGRREIWHWFVLAAAALLTIEWFLYAWRMRV